MGCLGLVFVLHRLLGIHELGLDDGILLSHEFEDFGKDIVDYLDCVGMSDIGDGLEDLGVVADFHLFGLFLFDSGSDRFEGVVGIGGEVGHEFLAEDFPCRFLPHILVCHLKHHPVELGKGGVFKAHGLEGLTDIGAVLGTSDGSSGHGRLDGTEVAHRGWENGTELLELVDQKVGLQHRPLDVVGDFEFLEVAVRIVKKDGMVGGDIEFGNIVKRILAGLESGKRGKHHPIVGDVDSVVDGFLKVDAVVRVGHAFGTRRMNVVKATDNGTIGTVAVVNITLWLETDKNGFPAGFDKGDYGFDKNGIVERIAGNVYPRGYFRRYAIVVRFLHHCPVFAVTFINVEDG